MSELQKYNYSTTACGEAYEVEAENGEAYMVEDVDALIATLKAERDELQVANDYLVNERNLNQLVSNEAISYLYEEWPSCYSRFYNLVDSECQGFINKVKASAIREAISGAPTNCEAQDAVHAYIEEHANELTSDTESNKS